MEGANISNDGLPHWKLNHVPEVRVPNRGTALSLLQHFGFIHWPWTTQLSSKCILRLTSLVYEVSYYPTLLHYTTNTVNSHNVPPLFPSHNRIHRYLLDANDPSRPRSRNADDRGVQDGGVQRRGDLGDEAVWELQRFVFLFPFWVL